MREQTINEIKRLLVEYKQYPQGLRVFGIEGRRDSELRCRLYQLDLFLKPHFTVLDIGCNCGFIDTLIAPNVRRLVGYDLDPVMVKIAQLSASALLLTNCFYFQGDFNDNENPMIDLTMSRRKYDFVMACQLHHWVKVPFVYFAQRVLNTVKVGGYLLFESHDTDTIDQNFNEKVAIFQSLGCTIAFRDKWVEQNPGQYWIPAKIHKDIPRKFVIFRRTTEK